MAGSEFGEVVIAFDAENSLLIELVTKYSAGSHPAELGEAQLSHDDIEVLKEWISTGAKSPNGQVPFEDPSELVYVTNQGEAMVDVIGTQSNTVVRRIDLTTLGFSINAKPHHIAVEDDGSYWYLTLISEGGVLKFNRLNEMIDQAAFEVPGLLALDPSSDRLFVGRSMAAVNPAQRIGIIDRSTMNIDEVDVFHPRPHALAVSPTGEFVLSGSLGENRIIAINMESGDATRY